MSEQRRLERMDQLLDLRKREVDRLSSDMAGKRLVRQRYLDNLARLELLCTSSGPSGAQKHPQHAQVLSPTLSLNCGSYKQAVMKLADVHRVDLSLHEAQMQTTQKLMTTAARKQAALEQAVLRRRLGVERRQNTREQKRQDDLATQVWLRGER